MPELSDGLFSVYKRVDGAKFRGHLTSATASTTKENAPYRVMYVRTPTFVQAGDTVITNGGEVVVLMDHPDDFTWARSYKAVYALDKLSWERETKTIDPVSKTPKGNGWVTLGTLYVNFDSPEEVRMEGLTDTKYRFITGQDVKVGDRVDGKIVKYITLALGVKIVYAE